MSFDHLIVNFMNMNTNFMNRRCRLTHARSTPDADELWGYEWWNTIDEILAALAQVIRCTHSILFNPHLGRNETLYRTMFKAIVLQYTGLYAIAGELCLQGSREALITRLCNFMPGVPKEIVATMVPVRYSLTTKSLPLSPGPMHTVPN